MHDIGVISYGAGAVAFLLLTVVLAIGWRGKGAGAMLVLASALTMIWAGACALYSRYELLSIEAIMTIEVVRDVIWLLFLFQNLGYTKPGLFMKEKTRSYLVGGVFAFSLAIIIVALIFPSHITDIVNTGYGINGLTLLLLLLAVAVLVLTEQFFRNTRRSKKWAVKYLCLGIAVLFVYDFYMYSEALLLKSVDETLWLARGAVYLIASPMIAVSAARNPNWALDVYVSRSAVFYSTTLVGAGIYLLVMAATGYYIRIYGGTWGKVLQTTFLFGALVMLVVVLFSGQFRAQLKVFLSKHFFNYKYDYREEWLRFINTLAGLEDEAPLRRRAIKGVAQIVESPGGALWLRDEDGVLRFADHWNSAGFASDLEVSPDGSMVGFLSENQWIINIQEYAHAPDAYQDLELPVWLRDSGKAWLIVPLMLHEDLFGFIVLERSMANMEINWEDCDLLKTAGHQAASYLAQHKAAQALAEARQFEAFHRLSAFVVHDLKNISAQLSLIVSNAARHKENPEFLDDAFSTVDNAVSKMNKMLVQLRKDPSLQTMEESVSLKQVVNEVCALRAEDRPRAQQEFREADARIIADRERLIAVLEHLVQNAQEATSDEGYVKIILDTEGNEARMVIVDNGKGMDSEFIREKLFKPFETTKGNAGMGIGAYEAREYIRSIGGRLYVESAPGKGTTFSISLPLASPHTTGLEARTSSSMKRVIN